MVDYQKLYATLLGRVDEALQYNIWWGISTIPAGWSGPRSCCAWPFRRRRRTISGRRRNHEADGSSGSGAGTKMEQRRACSPPFFVLYCIYHLKWGSMVGFPNSHVR